MGTAQGRWCSSSGAVRGLAASQVVLVLPVSLIPFKLSLVAGS